MITTTTDQPDARRERKRLMEEFHQPTFNSLRIEDPLFIPKLFYKPAGKQEKCIAFFASEISKGQDIYTEFADQEFVPQDPDRRLYKWRFNPNYMEEYDVSETNGSIRYFIPVSELILVKSNSVDVLVEQKGLGSQATLDLKVSPTITDIPLMEATLRDFAAIMLQKPVSTKEWLNDIIKKAK